MATTNLFGAPGVQGRRVHVQRPPRPAGRDRQGDARRSTSAPSWAPRSTSSGAGARAPRSAPRRIPRDALERYREAIDVLCDYVARSGLRAAFRDRAQAERAARRHLPADRRARAALHHDAAPPRDGRRQPRGRARDDGGAGVPSRRRPGAVGGQAVPHRSQRASGSAATTRTSASAPRTSRRPSCSCGCSSAPATTAPGTSTPTRTATRTRTASGTSRAAACAPTRALAEKARHFDSLPEVQEALAAAGADRAREPRRRRAMPPDALKAEAEPRRAGRARLRQRAAGPAARRRAARSALSASQQALQPAAVAMTSVRFGARRRRPTRRPHRARACSG